MEVDLDGFDSIMVASRLHMPLKHASNDLRRLYRMGFLNRRRVRRGCLTLSGKICFKGFEYRYRLSSQGRKYVEWLENVKMIEDLEYAKLTGEVLSYLPQELKDKLAMISLRKAAMKYRGPSRSMRLLENNAIPVIHLATENMRLKSEKEQLELENGILRMGAWKFLENIRGVEEQNRSLYNALAQTLVWAALHKNSAEYWRDQFRQASSMYIQQSSTDRYAPRDIQIRKKE